MSLKAKHPSYLRYSGKWQMLHDLYEGEDQIKSRGDIYLPPTSSMHIDGMGLNMPGWQAYQAYKMRAVVPDYVKNAVDTLVGLMHQKQATFELPKAMEYLRENATDDGEDLGLVLRKVHAQQLLTGRLGIMPELPEELKPGVPEFKLCIYNAHSIANWDDNFIILDECEEEVNDQFEWKLKEKYRVLKLIDGVYHYGVFNDETYIEANMLPFMVFSGNINFIPFTFINAIDLTDDVCTPPLLGLAYDCLKIYRGEADLRQALFMQGQDTLVLIGQQLNTQNIPGNDEPVRVGAGSVVNMDFGGDAKFIGVSANGLDAMRSTIAEDKKEAQTKAGQLITNSLMPESGTSLKTRITAQTATLNQIAMAGAKGLEAALKQIAMMINADPEQVIVTPNLEFADYDIVPKDIIDLMTAKTMGAPIALETIHDFMADTGLTRKDFTTETDLINSEGG